MKKIYYFLVNSGRVVFIWSILFIASVSFYSLTIRGKVNYGDRCYQIFDDAFIKEYKYEGIEIKSGYLKCNTYYLQYNSLLEESDNILFLVSLSKLFYDKGINIDVHIIIENENYQLISTIVDYRVSYTKTLM